MYVASVAKLIIAFWLSVISVTCSSNPSTHYRVLRESPGGPALCGVSSITHPATTVAVRSRVHCSAECLAADDCLYFNYRTPPNQQPVCEQFQSLPLSYSVDPNCALYQEDGMLAEPCYPAAPDSALQTCSFPYTYNGGLYYSCMENMTGVSTASQPFACVGVNRTAANCVSCHNDFTAENVTIDINIPPQPTAIPVMSVFGWIMIHQHLGYSFDWRLPWADYKAGFGSLNADFWLGLERVHLLTSSQPYRLRVEMQQKVTDKWFSVEYWNFRIGDELNDAYRLDVSGYSGDAGDALQSTDDWHDNTEYGYYYHDGNMFSTYDRDNDGRSWGHCADIAGFNGWWHDSCYQACLTCGVVDNSWGTLYPDEDRIQNSRMMVKPQ